MNRAVALTGSGIWLLAAPGVVCGALPGLITRWERPDAPQLALDAAAVFVAVPALAVLLQAFFDFAWHGHGTPAPAAPTERLVVRGPYRFVRNPMYVAVIALLVAQIIAFPSWALLAYTVLIALAVSGFVTLYEEPTLRQQFPKDYADYSTHVRRWIPRLTPWTPPRSHQSRQARGATP